MRDLTETDEESLDLASLECLKRTRSGVLNVLVGVGGRRRCLRSLLRGRTSEALVGPQEPLSQALLLSLLGFSWSALSLAACWAAGRGSAILSLRGPRFFWVTFCRPPIGALAAPLGLIHGWLISPRLEAILPFWVVALVLGILAYPRGRELEGFDQPMAPAGEPA